MDLPPELGFRPDLDHERPALFALFAERLHHEDEQVLLAAIADDLVLDDDRRTVEMNCQNFVEPVHGELQHADAGF